MSRPPAYPYAVAAQFEPGERRRQILSRHRSVRATEQAARKQARWDIAHGYQPSEAVCLDGDGHICSTIAECREAGTLQ